TARPTAESMLRAFKGIALIMITAGKQIQPSLTPLSNLQRQILRRLDFPVSIYTRLAADYWGPS
ncbi:hypothetical protein M1N82_02250, partial [Dehalococcoidia bacterium]|nr:hypothetical protein [Dehalococcoidia bacterium]